MPQLAFNDNWVGQKILLGVQQVDSQSRHFFCCCFFLEFSEPLSPSRANPEDHKSPTMILADTLRLTRNDATI